MSLSRRTVVASAAGRTRCRIADLVTGLERPSYAPMPTRAAPRADAAAAQADLTRRAATAEIAPCSATALNTSSSGTAARA